MAVSAIDIGIAILLASAGWLMAPIARPIALVLLREWLGTR
jgi:hypothetical protein